MNKTVSKIESIVNTVYLKVDDVVGEVELGSTYISSCVTAPPTKSVLWLQQQVTSSSVSDTASTASMVHPFP